MTKSFRSDLHRLRPDAASEVEASTFKWQIAMALRALRKSKGMTQNDVKRNSTLSQPMISRLESPTGPLPTWDTVTRYVAACRGHMVVGFSNRRVDEAAFVESQAEGAGMVAAVAV